ncbi:albusnodin family lasso peptide [Nocardiopsis sp. N85]|nr:albusnodin family lasso peptide [Nocardiopsis sp. N85]MDE3724846.1 albusnodin family lasso peptide [Nocardiopsis sp. N85]
MDTPEAEARELSEEVLVELGDAADLTLGQGRAQNENKRNPYN